MTSSDFPIRSKSQIAGSKESVFSLSVFRQSPFEAGKFQEFLGAIEARKGNRTDALSLLRQAVDRGLPSSDALGMESDPDLKSLDGEPRFITMIADAK